MHIELPVIQKTIVNKERIMPYPEQLVEREEQRKKTEQLKNEK